MASVKVRVNPWKDTEHVTAAEAHILFVDALEVDGHLVRTETPEGKAWREKVAKAKTVDQVEPSPENAWPQPEISIGEGFMILTIKHADDETWAYLSTLPDDEYAWGSTREDFGVIVSSFEYEVIEPAVEYV